MVVGVKVAQHHTGKDWGGIFLWFADCHSHPVLLSARLLSSFGTVPIQQGRLYFDYN